jgi:hypothetical protein
MPSERIAAQIRDSLAPDERFVDFGYMFDTLLFLRAPYNQDLGLSERIVGRLLCVIFPDKPDRYVGAMQQFRLGFAGVATDPELQAEFSNTVRRAAITLRDPQDVVWRPSVYFGPSPRLLEQKDIKKWWF